MPPSSLLTSGKLYNDYADQASYYDLCLLIYETADHRNEQDIRSTWSALLTNVHEKAEAGDDASSPWEVVAATVRTLGRRLNLSETTFNPRVLLPMLEAYAIERQPNVTSATWVIDIFIDLGIPFEILTWNLESIWLSNETPFVGRQKARIATDMLRVIVAWYNESRAQIGSFGASAGRTGLLFGSDENTVSVSGLLGEIAEARVGGLAGQERERARELRARIEGGMI